MESFNHEDMSRELQRLRKETKEQNKMLDSLQDAYALYVAENLFSFYPQMKNKLSDEDYQQLSNMVFRHSGELLLLLDELNQKSKK